MSKRRHRDRGRAFVLLAMLVAIGTAMLVTSAVIWAARSEHAGRTATTDGIRRRAAAWSAAQAISAEIGSQRPLVLAGGEPTLPLQLLLYEDGASVALARLLPAAADGRMIVAEAGLLDVNSAGVEALMAAGLDEEVANLVVVARHGAGGALSSLEEVVDRPAVAASLLRGERAFDHEAMAIVKSLRGGEHGRALGGAGSALDGAGSRIEEAGDRLEVAGSRLHQDAGDASDSESPSKHAIGSRGVPLGDLVSAYSVEPALSRSGERRVELDEAWAEVLRDRLGGQLDAARLRRLEAMSKEGAAIENDQALVKALASIGIAPQQWGEVLDEVTAEPGPWRWSRLDINHADAAVLAAIPSLTPDQVARIVRARDSLDPSERANPVWPVLRGIVEPEAFASLYPSITTRSFFWRVRFVAGFAGEDDVDGVLSAITVWECVVDLTGDRPRIASLRDLSLAPTLARLMKDRPALAKASDEEAIRASDAMDDSGASLNDGAMQESSDRVPGAGTVDDAPSVKEGSTSDDPSAPERDAPAEGSASSKTRAKADADSASKRSERPKRPRPESHRPQGRAQDRVARGERSAKAEERAPSGDRKSEKADREENSDDAKASDRKDGSDQSMEDSGPEASTAKRRPGAPPPVGRYRPRAGRAAGAATPNAPDSRTSS